jgi:cytosine/adenosine deaminase-related metal-dependent hydrolase
VYSALVYAASPRDVRTTIVHGRILMEDRAVKSLDPAAIKARMRALAAKINAAIAAGLK